MDIDDILKLLLIALFLLPGFFAKKKKRENNQQQQPPQRYEYEDPYNDFKTFESEDDFIGKTEEKFEEKQSPFHYKPAPAELTPEQEGSSVFTKEQIEAALASIAKQEKENDEISQNEITDNETDVNINADNEFLQDFDVRHAMIYSEIIKAKY
ncbi:MAG: hypothetical protein LBJ63_10895 [Prevotellaceae bacterium]|jgi:hypothetical protein|nr:hypothetical protein [Prevotellaceae bacterium]